MEALQSFKCTKHPTQNVAFFCTVNQWHFVPLCNQCIPPHTQNHPKNFKISLESSQKVRQHCQSQSTHAIAAYKKRLQTIQNNLQSSHLPPIFSTLQKTEQQLISLIKSYISKIKQELHKKMEDTIKFQIQLLNKLKQNIQADIIDIQKSISMQSGANVEQWAEVVRRLYFKDGINPYLEEIDDIVKEHAERVYGRELGVVESGKLEDGLRKLLQSHITVTNNVQKVQKIEQKKNIKQTKKQSKIVIKPKVCKVCNGELEYLTQLKKHLFCPTCGGKQRNYTKKQ